MKSAKKKLSSTHAAVDFISTFRKPTEANVRAALGPFPLPKHLNNPEVRCGCSSSYCFKDIDEQCYYTNDSGSVADAGGRVVWNDLPRPSDQDAWLANYNEKGQDVMQFAAQHRSERREGSTIFLLPIVESLNASFDTNLWPDFAPDMSQLQQWASIFYDRPVKILQQALVVRTKTSGAEQLFDMLTERGGHYELSGRVSPDGVRQQLHTSHLLRALASIKKGGSSRTHVDEDLSDASCLVGVTMADLYSSDPDLFVAGMAGRGGAAVFSFSRYHPLVRMSYQHWYDYGYLKAMPRGGLANASPYFDELGPRPKLASMPSTSTTLDKRTRAELFRRTGRLLVHELGHLHGFEHCIYYHCLMNGAGNLLEDFATPAYLCGVCLRKLQYLQGFDVKNRYAGLAKLFAHNNMVEEFEWVNTRLSTIGGGTEETGEASNLQIVLPSTLKKRSRNSNENDKEDDKNKIEDINLLHYPSLCHDRGTACVLTFNNSGYAGSNNSNNSDCRLDQNDADALVDLLVGGSLCSGSSDSSTIDASSSTTVVPVGWDSKCNQYILPPSMALHLKLLLRRCKEDPFIEFTKILFIFACRLNTDELLSVLRAGFVVFAQALQVSYVSPPISHSSKVSRKAPSIVESADIPLSESGILSLELAGVAAQRSSEDDHGGRILLTDVASKLIVGKKSTKSVRDCVDSDSGIFNSSAVSKADAGSAAKAYRLQVSFDFENGVRAWNRCVEMHGEDWMGFPTARDAYMAMWMRQQEDQDTGNNYDNCAPKLLVISLIDEQVGKSNASGACNNAIVSEEIGVLVGSIYSCMSNYTLKDASYSRADKVRSNAAVLWLHRAGVQAFDAGTTAQYYVDLSGYRRTTREEFVSEWRRLRDLPLPRESASCLIASCRKVRSLLEEHRTKCGGGAE